MRGQAYRILHKQYIIFPFNNPPMGKPIQGVLLEGIDN